MQCYSSIPFSRFIKGSACLTIIYPHVGCNNFVVIDAGLDGKNSLNDVPHSLLGNRYRLRASLAFRFNILVYSGEMLEDYPMHVIIGFLISLSHFSCIMGCF